MISFLVTVSLSFIILVIALVLFRYVGVPIYRVQAVNVQAILKFSYIRSGNPIRLGCVYWYTIRHDAELDKIRCECAMLADEITERQGKLVFTEPSRHTLANLLGQVELKIEASK